jgi:hypothetical protein
VLEYKGTYYHWDTTTGSNIKGNVLGVDIELTPSVSFELGQENNNTMDATSYFPSSYSEHAIPIDI